jgi:pimeloyl-ACP methyl ester carboxylesterase
MENLRTHGQPPYDVVVVHGGPGAGGEMAPVAELLSRERGVLEPLQTAMSVEEQIEELRGAIESHGAPPVVLIGYSWGAWLSLLVAARYPTLVKKLLLVGSGPFEERYAVGIMATRLSRLSEVEAKEARSLIDALSSATGDTNASFARMGELLSKADAFDPLPNDAHGETNDEIYRRVWPEAAELRRSGRLLEIARDVQCPVVAIHGDYDPHPAEGVSEPLSRVARDFRFVLIEKCGHTPWTERLAKVQFYEVVRSELA